MIASNVSNGPMYCHGISTLMLAEVVGMLDNGELAEQARAALGRAIKVIVAAQDRRKGKEHAGGWRYQPSSDDSDLSVTGWQLMALRAARSAGCEVPSEHIDRAIAYVKRCAVKNGGGFTYQPGGGPNNPRTGTGILALEICGDHLTPEAVAGAEYLLKHPPQWSGQSFFYEVYYCPLGLFQLGDKYFLSYYPKLVSILLTHQGKDGSWLDERQPRPHRRPQLLHGHGRPGPDGRISLFAHLSEIIGSQRPSFLPRPRIRRKEIAMKAPLPPRPEHRRSPRSAPARPAAARGRSPWRSS